MAIQVRTQDGTIQSFPDGTSPDAVRTAMTAYEVGADKFATGRSNTGF